MQTEIWKKVKEIIARSFDTRNVGSEKVFWIIPASNAEIRAEKSNLCSAFEEESEEFDAFFGDRIFKGFF